MKRLLLLFALFPLLACAQRGLIEGRQIITYNETAPGGSAVDILAIDDSSVIVFQAGMNSGGQGNIVVNSDAGPGFDSVYAVGQEAVTMFAVTDDAAGGERVTIGIEDNDGLITIIEDGGAEVMELSANAANEGELIVRDGSGNNQVHIRGGNATLRHLMIGNASTTLGSMGFYNANNNFITAILPNATPTASTTFVLPPDAGTTGYVLVNTDGAGTTAWQASGAAGGVAGVDRDIQIHDSGVFGVVAPPNRIYADSDANNAIIQLLMDDTGGVAGINGTSYSGSGTNLGMRMFAVGSRGSASSPSATQAGDRLFGFEAGGRGATTWGFTKSYFRVRAAQNWTDSAMGTRMDFAVTPLNSTTVALRWSLEPDGTWLPGTDSAYDIGVGGATPTRVDQVFADYLNAPVHEIENAGGTARFSLINSGTLLVRDTAAATMLEFDGTDIIAHEAKIRPNSANGTALGDSAQYFSEGWFDDVYVEGPAITPAYVVRLYEDTGGGVAEFYDDEAIGVPDLLASIGADSGNDGHINLYTNDGDIFVQIGESFGPATSDSGSIALYDSSAREKIAMGVELSGSPVLWLKEPGSGSSVEVRLEARAAEDNADSLVISNDSSGTLITMGQEASEGRANFFDGSTIRAIIGSNASDGFVNLTSNAGSSIILSSVVPSITINSQQVMTSRQTGNASIACTIDGTYDAVNEGACITSLVNAMNQLRTSLGTSGHGLLTSP